MKRLVPGLALLVLLAVPGPAQGQTPPPGGPGAEPSQIPSEGGAVKSGTIPTPTGDPGPVRWDDGGIRFSPLITLENHIQFRFRLNTFYNLDLGLGPDQRIDPNCVPATSDAVGPAAALGDSKKPTVSANLRLRYEPTLRIGELVTVHARVDLLDNVVMGTSPRTNDVGWPMAVFARGQRPGDGPTDWRDSLSVKGIWGEVRLFGLAKVVGGRIPTHFGLGLVRNAGSGWDSDYGDHADGVHLKVKLFSAYLFVGMEFPGEGATSDSPFGYPGEPHDADQMDDVTRWVFGINTLPEDKAEIDARRKALEVDRKVVLDGGWYNTITQQDLDLDLARDPVTGAGSLTDLTAPYDQLAVVPRGAFFWTPSLWGRLLYQPRSDLRIRIETEWALVYGHVDHMQSSTTEDRSRKDFLSFGGAFEAQVDVGDNTVLFHAGMASGGNSLGVWGIQDQQLLATPNPQCYDPDRLPQVFRTSDIHHFVFNRDYRIDSILFREIIGSVTNAFYFKPAYRRLFLREGGWELGAGASVLAAFASIAEGAPGGQRPLGIEGGVEVWAKWGKYLTLHADGAALFPLAGLQRPDSPNEVEPAAALRVSAAIAF